MTYLENVHFVQEHDYVFISEFFFIDNCVEYLSVF